MKRNYFIVGAVMVAVVLLATVLVFPQLADRIPSHWNVHNQVDRYSAKWAVFLVPAMMLGLMGLFAILPWISPRQFAVDSFRSTYLYMMLVILGIMGYIQGLLLWAAAGRNLNMTGSMMGGICILFALLGNVMGKVRRNFYVGVRTPWTIANERVWNTTHRFAGRTMVVGGVIGLLLTVLGMGFWFPFAAVMVGALSPVVFSLIYYKQLERRGEV